MGFQIRRYGTFGWCLIERSLINTLMSSGECFSGMFSGGPFLSCGIWYDGNAWLFRIPRLSTHISLYHQGRFGDAVEIVGGFFFAVYCRRLTEVRMSAIRGDLSRLKKDFTWMWSVVGSPLLRSKADFYDELGDAGLHNLFWICWIWHMLAFHIV